jgi:hypothetical protein
VIAQAIGFGAPISRLLQQNATAFASPQIYEEANVLLPESSVRYEVVLDDPLAQVFLRGFDPGGFVPS